MFKKSSQWSVIRGQATKFYWLSPSFFIFSFLVFTFHFGLAQSSPTAYYNPIGKLRIEAGASFTTDNLQNMYIYHGSSIKKYTPQGQLLYTYSDKSYGAITWLDVNDPMKMLVFYKDFPEIILLDNTLSINGSPFSPADGGYPLTTLACTSHDNGVWLYDAQNFQLIRLDVNLNVVQKTGNLAQVIGIQLNPDYLMEYNNFIYLNDSAQGILVFDSYGTYYKTIPITGLTSFQVRENDLFYVSKSRIHTFHLKTIMEDEIKAPDTLATEVRIEKNILYERYNDTLRVYDIVPGNGH